VWNTLPTCTTTTCVSKFKPGSGPRTCAWVFWLNGLAGTGKSTIATTICERLDKKQLLGASFFISRQQADTRDASNIVRSIAHGLTSRNRLIAEALCATLRDGSASVARCLGKQIADFMIVLARRLSKQATS
jgi:thymidylate kinase